MPQIIPGTEFKDLGLEALKSKGLPPEAAKDYSAFVHDDGSFDLVKNSDIPGPLGTLGRVALRNAPASAAAGFAMASLPAAAEASTGVGIIPALGTLAVGTGVGWLADKAVEKALPEDIQRQIELGEVANPKSAALGRVASMLAGFRPGLPKVPANFTGSVPGYMGRQALKMGALNEGIRQGSSLALSGQVAPIDTGTVLEDLAVGTFMHGGPRFGTGLRALAAKPTQVAPPDWNWDTVRTKLAAKAQSGSPVTIQDVDALMSDPQMSPQLRDTWTQTPVTEREALLNREWLPTGDYVKAIADTSYVPAEGKQTAMDALIRQGLRLGYSPEEIHQQLLARGTRAEGFLTPQGGYQSALGRMSGKLTDLIQTYRQLHAAGKVVPAGPVEQQILHGIKAGLTDGQIVEYVQKPQLASLNTAAGGNIQGTENMVLDIGKPTELVAGSKGGTAALDRAKQMRKNDWPPEMYELGLRLPEDQFNAHDKLFETYKAAKATTEPTPPSAAPAAAPGNVPTPPQPPKPSQGPVEAPTPTATKASPSASPEVHKAEVTVEKAVKAATEPGTPPEPGASEPGMPPVAPNNSGGGKLGGGSPALLDTKPAVKTPEPVQPKEAAPSETAPTQNDAAGTGDLATKQAVDAELHPIVEELTKLPQTDGTVYTLEVKGTRADGSQDVAVIGHNSQGRTVHGEYNIKHLENVKNLQELLNIQRDIAYGNTQDHPNKSTTADRPGPAQEGAATANSPEGGAAGVRVQAVPEPGGQAPHGEWIANKDQIAKLRAAFKLADTREGLMQQRANLVQRMGRTASPDAQRLVQDQLRQVEDRLRSIRLGEKPPAVREQNKIADDAIKPGRPLDEFQRKSLEERKAELEADMKRAVTAMKVATQSGNQFAARNAKVRLANASAERKIILQQLGKNETRASVNQLASEARTGTVRASVLTEPKPTPVEALGDQVSAIEDPLARFKAAEEALTRPGLTNVAIEDLKGVRAEALPASIVEGKLKPTEIAPGETVPLEEALKATEPVELLRLPERLEALESVPSEQRLALKRDLAERGILMSDGELNTWLLKHPEVLTKVGGTVPTPKATVTKPKGMRVRPKPASGQAASVSGTPKPTGQSAFLLSPQAVVDTIKDWGVGIKHGYDVALKATMDRAEEALKKIGVPDPTIIRRAYEETKLDFRRILNNADHILMPVKLTDSLSHEITAAMDHGNTTGTLGPLSAKAADYLQRIKTALQYVRMNQLQHTTGMDPFWLPESMSNDVRKTLRLGRGAEFDRLKTEFTDYQLRTNQSMNLAEAAEKFNSVINAEVRDTGGGSFYGPTRKPEGLKLPPAWRDTLENSLKRYFRRAAYDIAYRQHFEDNPDVRKLVVDPPSAGGGRRIPEIEDLRHTMDAYFIGHGSSVDRAFSAINATVLGPMTMLNDVGSFAAIMPTVAKPSELIAAARHMGEFLSPSHVTGSQMTQAQKSGTMLLENLAEIFNPFDTAKGSNMYSKAMRMLNLRNAQEYITRHGADMAGRMMAERRPLKDLNEFVGYDLSGLSKQRQSDLVAQRMIAVVNGEYDPTGLPTWIARGTSTKGDIQGYARTVFGIMRWSFERQNNFQKTIIDPIIKHGNFVPLIVGAFGTVLAKEGVNEIVKWVKDESPSELPVTDLARLGSAREWAYSLAQKFRAIGTFGLLGNAFAMGMDAANKQLPEDPGFIGTSQLVKNLQHVYQGVDALTAGDVAHGLLDIAIQLLRDNIQYWHRPGKDDEHMLKRAYARSEPEFQKWNSAQGGNNPFAFAKRIESAEDINDADRAIKHEMLEHGTIPDISPPNLGQVAFAAQLRPDAAAAMEKKYLNNWPIIRQLAAQHMADPEFQQLMMRRKVFGRRFLGDPGQAVDVYQAFRPQE